MKLFKSLLVAPAAIGLLAPISTSASEGFLNEISNYSNLEQFDPADSFKTDEPSLNPTLAGGEGLITDDSHAGGFSETTTASFSVDASIGGIDGDRTTEATVFEYQFNVDLSISLGLLMSR